MERLVGLHFVWIMGLDTILLLVLVTDFWSLFDLVFGVGSEDRETDRSSGVSDAKGCRMSCFIVSVSWISVA